MSALCGTRRNKNSKARSRAFEVFHVCIWLYGFAFDYRLLVAGPWANDQRNALSNALGNAVADDDQRGATVARPQQRAPYVEHIFTESDRATLRAHTHNPEAVYACAGLRAYTVGLTCPGEKANTRLAAPTLVVGSGQSVSTRGTLKLMGDKIREAIKRADKLKKHPFPHAVVLPDPREFNPELLQFAYDGVAPQRATEQQTQQIDLMIAGGPCARSSAFRSASGGGTPS